MRESRFTAPKTNIIWHGCKPKVRRDGHDNDGRDGASIEAIAAFTDRLTPSA
jgi:hypothetical protein